MRPLQRKRRLDAVYACAALTGRTEPVGLRGDQYYRPREWLSSALWGAIAAGCTGPDLEDNIFRGIRDGKHEQSDSSKS